MWTNLKNDLKKKLINSRMILSSFRLIAESSRKSTAYSDPTYIPFYYYLSKYISPKNMLEVGFHLGLLSGTFLRSNKSVENFLAFQERNEEYYSLKIPCKNIKNVWKGNFDAYYGNLLDEAFENKLKKNNWDLAIFNFSKKHDECMNCLQTIWPYISMDGYCVVEYVKYSKEMKSSFESFCKINNKDFIIMDTRYGVGIVQK